MDLGWPEPPEERLRTAFRQYRDAPSYEIMRQVRSRVLPDERWRGRAPIVQAWAGPTLWDEMRTLLQQELEPLAAPVTLVLWADWFEDAATVDEAWAQLSREPMSDRGLERLLKASGPVPFQLKAEWFATSRLRQHRWARQVFDALCFSVTDVYGDTEPASALELLSRLRFRV